MAFVCGQEPSEGGIDTQRALADALDEKSINATFEYWGYDVSHAWHWWLEETRQMLPAVLKVGGLEERRLTADLSYAKVEAEHAREVLADEKEGLASARDARPRSDGARSITAHEQTHFQNSFSAWPFSRHTLVSPPSCTKNIDSISVRLIMPKNSAWLPSSL
jgi:hypothetical protein